MMHSKAHLTAIQFAKNNGMLEQYVQHDRDTMQYYWIEQRI